MESITLRIDYDESVTTATRLTDNVLLDIEGVEDVHEVFRPTAGA